MKKLLVLIFCLFATPLFAQTGTVQSQSQLNTLIGQPGCTQPTCLFPDNTSGAITPYDLRQYELDLVATLYQGSGAQTVTSTGSSFTIGCAAPWANTTGALLANNCNINFTGVTTTFINTYLPGYLDSGVANATFAAPSGNIAGIFAAASSQKPSGDGFTSLTPIQCLAVVDSFAGGFSDTSFTGAWCGYDQLDLLAATDPSVHGGTYGALGRELSIDSKWTYEAVDPYTTNPNAGTHGYRVDCLNDDECGAAYEVVANGSTFGTGYMCGHGALTLLSSVAPCLSMDLGHEIAWYYGAADIGATITSTVNSSSDVQKLVFGNTGLTYSFNGSTSIILQSSGVLDLASGGNLQISSNLVLAAGSLVQYGSSSGTVTVDPQSAAGTPSLSWPTASGTLVSTAGSHLSISSTTGQITTDATNADTASTIMARDGSGNFIANQMTGNVISAAGTTLQLEGANGYVEVLSGSTETFVFGPSEIQPQTTNTYALGDSTHTFSAIYSSSYFAGASQGLTTVCTVTALDTLTFTDGILTTKGVHCT